MFETEKFLTLIALIVVELSCGLTYRLMNTRTQLAGKLSLHSVVVDNNV